MKKILVLLSLLIATPSYAFSLAPADQSAQYLGSLFGHIGTILQGNASPMIGHLFYAFNFAMLLLCTILIIYTLFTGILKNSEDGEMMGRPALSRLIPVRMVLGMGLLLPTVSGYSVLQALVMWVVLQGAGAGDVIWNAAVDGLFKGGSVSPPATLTSDPSANQQLYTAATHLLSAQVCVNAMQSIYGNNGSFSCQIQPIANQTNQYQIICGGIITDDNGNTNKLGALCGSVTPDYASVAQLYPDQINNGPSNAPIYSALHESLTQMLQAVQPAAQTLADDANAVLQGTPANQTKKVPSNAISNAVNVYQRLVGQAIATYVTQENKITISNLNVKACNKNINHCDLSQEIATPAQMKATGWFDAGNYYLAIAEKSYLHANTIKLNSVAAAQPLPALQTDVIDTSKLPGTIWKTYAAAVSLYANADAANYFINTSAPSWITASQLPPNNNQGAEYIIQAMDTSLSQWSNLFNALQGNNSVQFYDPIMLLQQFGHDLMMNTVTAYKMEGAYFSQKSYGEWLSNIFGKLFGNEDYDRMISAMWYLPLGGTILSMMMVSGMMLAIYLPLIPFILFALAGIGWLLGVIEAIVAVPIVCFGIMHPRGDHDLLGKSEPGLMLLLNVFIRPSLIILSMLLGMGLIYVALEVINNSFSHVAGSMLTFSGDLRDPFTATCLIAVYTLFIVLVVQKCFSLISIVPDSVLRWIQGGNVTQEQFGEMGQVAQQMDQIAGRSAQQLGQGLTKTSQEQAQGQLSIAKNNAAAEDGLFKLGS